MARFLWHPEKFLAKLDTSLDSKLAKSADIVSEYAKGICPVKTGRLRDSIHTEKGSEELQYLIGSDVEYSLPVEMGHMTETKKGSKMVPAYPYLRPALDGSVSAIQEIFNS